MNTSKKLTTVIFVLVLLFITSAGNILADMVIPKGHEVKVQFDPGMKISSGKVQKGIPLLIYLAEDIVIADVTLVEKGAEGKAEVLEVIPASKPGKPGSIKIGFIELSPKGEFKPADGEKIQLMGEAEGKGKGKKLLSYLFIFGLFIKGSQGEIKADSIYTAQISDNEIMKSE